MEIAKADEIFPFILILSSNNNRKWGKSSFRFECFHFASFLLDPAGISLWCFVVVEKNVGEDFSKVYSTHHNERSSGFKVRWK